MDLFGNPSKRFFSETSPDQHPEQAARGRKVSDLDVEDLKMIMKNINKEVLEKLEIISGDVYALKQQNVWLKEQVDGLQADKELDRKRIVQLEEQIKSKNLLFKGLEAKQAVLDEVSKVCTEKLELPTASIIKSTRKIFERDGKMTALTEFDSTQSVEKVLQKAKNLAGSKIFIERDLNVDRQQDKKVMLQLKKEIKVLSTAHKLAVVNDKLKIKDKWFRWNKNKKLVCGQQDVDVILSSLYANRYSKIVIDYKTLLKNFMSKSQTN